MLGLTYEQVSLGWQDAWDALPEAYKADSCLVFRADNGTLVASPASGQEYTLGTWEAYWDLSGECWRDSATNEPLGEPE